MPNWCNNSLTLRFPTKEEAKEFNQHVDRVESESKIQDEHNNDLTILGYFVPEPDYNHQEQGWYWWRVENWGTKWDINLYERHFVDDYTVFLGFDTAWSPPIETYGAMTDQGVYVEASYYEPGMCFVGTWVGGDDDFYNYAEIEDPQEIRDYIGSDLDDEWNISEWMREYIEEENANHIDSDSGVENFGRN
jgi:hypothetical protein